MYGEFEAIQKDSADPGFRSMLVRQVPDHLQKPQWGTLA